MNKFSRERLGRAAASFSPPAMPATISPVLPSLLSGIGAADGGAGALSVDRVLWGWTTWPSDTSLSLFGTAVVVAILTWIVVNGTNPIHV